MNQRPRRGMTLVELMVALVLGSILIGVVTFVWMQSNKIFTTTINKLEIYQRLRTVLDVMERDLANTDRTVDMELYVDADPDGAAGPLKPNGHYSAPDGDAATIDDTVMSFRVPLDSEDPLYGHDEFGGGLDATGRVDLDAGNPFQTFPMQLGQVDAFLYAGAVLSPEPYAIDDGYTAHRYYWRDEVYVRTYTMVDGLNKPALVHYRLVQTADKRSVLRRRLWYLNENRELIPPPGTPAIPATDRTTVLTNGITDLKVAFYFKETTSQEVGGTSGVGHWYHIGNRDDSWGQEARELRDLDEQRGMLSARGNTTALSKQHQEQFDADMNAVTFLYQGSARIEDQEAGGVVLRGIDTADPTLYDKAASFPGVRAGDHFFVYDATDDDPKQSMGADLEAGEHFPDQILTVSLIYTDRDPVSQVDWAAVKFDQPINFFALGKSWLGRDVAGEIPTVIGDPVAGTFEADRGKGRKIMQSFDVKYRVGFLPAAFLVRLGCDDPYNRSIIMMERVIRLLQQ